MCNENFNKIYSEIKSNATEISEMKSIEKDCSEKTESEITFDMFKQSMTNTERITANCYESSEKNNKTLSYHGKLLLTIIFILAVLAVTCMVMM